MTNKEQQAAQQAWGSAIGTRAKALAQDIASAEGASPSESGNRVVLEPPDRVRYGHGTASIGAVVYKAIAALLASKGRMSRKKFCVAVWGEEKVKDATLWSVCYRVTMKLKEAGSPHRCGCDYGDIVLV